jgi:hypothetical protein
MSGVGSKQDSVGCHTDVGCDSTFGGEDGRSTWLDGPV